MKDPGRLINNRLFRAMVNRLGFTASRHLIRALLVTVLLSPSKKRRLRSRVQGYLTKFFPELGEAERRARTSAFIGHWGNKFAEDCITLSVRGVGGFATLIDRYVEYRNAENLHRALSHQTGILAVGCHVGSPTFGTLALLGLLRREQKVPTIRLCVEPGTERFPIVLELIEQALDDFGWDGGILIPQRQYPAIAVEISSLLAQGSIITTNLDVLSGGKSRASFPMFGRARIYLPALVGAARLALCTGATLLPWVNLRTQNGFRLVVEEPIGPVPRLGPDLVEDHPELLALCEQLRSQLENWIRANPEQWVYWDRWHYRLAESD